MDVYGANSWWSPKKISKTGGFKHSCFPRVLPIWLNPSMQGHNTQASRRCFTCDTVHEFADAWNGRVGIWPPNQFVTWAVNCLTCRKTATFCQWFIPPERKKAKATGKAAPLPGQRKLTGKPPARPWNRMLGATNITAVAVDVERKTRQA